MSVPRGSTFSILACRAKRSRGLVPCRSAKFDVLTQKLCGNGLGNYVQTRYHQKTGSVCLVLFRHHTLFGQFLFRILVFGKAREAHAAQHIASLGELNIIIADDFDTIAPGIAKI